MPILECVKSIENWELPFRNETHPTFSTPPVHRFSSYVRCCHLDESSRQQKAFDNKLKKESACLEERERLAMMMSTYVYQASVVL